MSEKLDKEMEDVVELEEADAATAKTDDHGDAVTKPTDKKKDLAKGAPKATPPKTHSSDASPSTGSPKLKSEMVQGLAAHIKGLKKEELEALYNNVLIEQEDEEEEESDEDDEEEEAPKKKNGNGNGKPEAEAEEKKVKESIEDRIDMIDVSDDVNALVDGEELSE